jgi:hypothetical protein
VPLVLVVPRTDPGVRRPQLERARRVALEVDDRLVAERDEREHLPADLHHRDLVAERVGLLGTRQGEAQREHAVTVHAAAPRHVPTLGVRLRTRLSSSRG